MARNSQTLPKFRELAYRPSSRVKDRNAPQIGTGAQQCAPTKTGTPFSPPVNGGTEEDEMLVSYAYAEVRVNPMGKEFIEIHSIASSVGQVKRRSAKLHGDAPDYKKSHPRTRMVLIEIREVGEEK